MRRIDLRQLGLLCEEEPPEPESDGERCEPLSDDQISALNRVEGQLSSLIHQRARGRTESLDEYRAAAWLRSEWLYDRKKELAHLIETWAFELRMSRAHGEIADQYFERSCNTETAIRKIQRSLGGGATSD